MLIVIALGGNALLRRGQPLEANIQRSNVDAAAKVIAQLAKTHQVIICHGNGPQVGLLALQAEAYKKVRGYPLDVLDAESQSMIGYMLQQAIKNQIPQKKVITVVTQVEIDPNDSAFNNPTKFIGPIYAKGRARALVNEHGWTMKEDGEYVRRVVPSPLPKHIVELDIIETLINSGVVTICGGGGGIPVVKEGQQLKGIEGVIDKDRTSALLAEKLNADALIILTDVDAVYENWGKPDAKAVKVASVQALRKTSFPQGSMGPKIEAACDFCEKSGNFSAIGHLDALLEIVTGTVGTRIIPMGDEIEYYD